MVERLEAVLINHWFWMAAVAILIALPFLLVFIQWVEAQGDLIALCRGLLFGGR